MAFSQFENIEQVIKKYPLNIQQRKFLPAVTKPLPIAFIEDIHFLLAMKAIEENESFFTESFIFPFLRETWKHHRQLKLWSHRSLVYDDELCGEPDYFLAALPADEVINQLVNKPILAVTEAKKENFTQGWGQCLAAMIACQKLNANPQITIYGIVSTGLMWEFSKLVGNLLVKDSVTYFINIPDQIFGILDFIFAECEKQL
jgi:hypothetical protein